MHRQTVRSTTARFAGPAATTAMVTAVLAATSAAEVRAVVPVFPGEHWQTRQPAEVGLDRAGLEEFARVAGGRGCVVRYGYLVYHWGDHTRSTDVASASKPFYSHLLFTAIEEGKLAGPDEKVVRWQPALAGLNHRLGYKDRQMTFRQLAYQTACLGYEDPPGTAFDYNDRTMGFFWDTLVNQVYGVSWEDADAALFRPKLAGPLQFEDDFTCNGPKPGRPNISPRDFARYGLLYLNEGKWGDRRLLGAEWARRAVSEPLPLSIPRTRARPADTCDPRSIGGGGNQCDHNGGYSWLWWLNRPARDGRPWFADAPDDMFLALGHCGRRGLAVMPKLQLIVSFNDTQELHCDRKLGNRAFQALAAAAEGM
ncbi:MAG: serine hydrolase [Pirellulales bacterium]|nr:serine hydrolase [Pirellulales bacterium]